MSYENFKLSLKIDGINTVRGTNQIIIYTYDKRSVDNTTGTNYYGYELAIDSSNRVCEKGTHVKFQENGIVISAHGTNGDIFADKIEIGDRLFYSKETNVIVFTRELSDIALRLEYKINDLQEQLDVYEKGLYDLDIDNLKKDLIIVKSNYNKIKKLINQNNSIENEKETITQIEKDIYEIEIRMVPSIVVESRGCWHRPNIYNTENSVEGIKSVLSEMKESGINAVYVETFWWGRSIGNSKIVGYHPRVMNGDYGEYDDYLSAFIDIAHKMDIEVHAWTEAFFIGGEANSELAPWIKGNEHWLNNTYEGGYVQTGKGTEEGFIFVDPSNPEVKDFLISYYKELSNYNLDGIQFDYIRYPHEDNVETSSGYTDYAISHFKEEKGLNVTDDLKELLIQNNTLFEEWKNWRKDHVSDFVQKVIKEIKKVNPDIQVSISVGADPEVAKRVLLQDWPTWVENGWIDIIAPMAYSRDIDYIKNIVRKMNDISKGLTFNYTGIGTFMEFPEIENVMQMIASRKEMGLGSVIFASQNIINQDKMKNALKNGINVKKAITPNSDINELLSVCFADILDKINRVYIVKSAMTSELREIIESRFSLIKQIGNNLETSLKETINEIDKLVYDILNYVNNDATKRIVDDLKYLENILNIKLSKMRGKGESVYEKE